MRDLNVLGTIAAATLLAAGAASAQVTLQSGDSIQSAIQPGVTEIVLSPGVYQGNVIVQQDVWIHALDTDGDGELADELGKVTIDCNDQGFGFTLLAGTLEGLVIKDGNYALGGGGIVIGAGSPKLLHCRVESCVTEGPGGGILCGPKSTPLLSGCEIVQNRSLGGETVPHAGYGGGVFCMKGSQPTLLNCLFDSNSSTEAGGGLAFHEADVDLTDCRFESNRASRFGAGIYSEDSSSSLEGCTITENRNTDLSLSARGAGMFVNGGTVWMENCNVFSNTILSRVKAVGGGLYFENATVRMNGGGLFDNAALCEGLPSRSLAAGGGLAAVGCELVQVVGFNVFLNRAEQTGAGAYAYGGAMSLSSTKDVVVNLCEFRGNLVRNDFPGRRAFGGALALRGLDDSSFSYNIFSGNLATTRSPAPGTENPFLLFDPFTWPFERPEIETSQGPAKGLATGSAVHVRACSPKFTRCTITGNLSDTLVTSPGFGFYVGGPSFTTITNSILWDNCSNGAPLQAYAEPGSLIMLQCSGASFDTQILGNSYRVFFDGNTLFENPQFCDPEPCTAAPTTEGEYGLFFTSKMKSGGAPCTPMGKEDVQCQSISLPLVLAEPRPPERSSGAEFRWHTEAAGSFAAAMLDDRGELVRTLVSEPQPLGEGSVIWDGTDDDGEMVEPGHYVFRVQAGDHTDYRSVSLDEHGRLARPAMPRKPIEASAPIEPPRSPCGAPIFVDGTRLPGGDGQTWETALADLGTALELATDCARRCPDQRVEVWIAQGYYPLDARESVTLTEPIILLGGFNGTETEAGQRDPQRYVTAFGPAPLENSAEDVEESRPPDQERAVRGR